VTTKEDFALGSVWEFTRDMADDMFLVVGEPTWDDEYCEHSVDIYILDDSKDPRRAGHRMKFNESGAYWHFSKRVA
jgi:hypothetical protein